MTTGERRRRADDWKATSDVRVDRRWFEGLVTQLGYEPQDVIGVRLNAQEAIVVSLVRAGVPTAVRHVVADSNV